MKLAARRARDVPLREVSGLALATGEDGTTVLVAVGDAASVVAWAPLLDGRPGGWQTQDLRAVEGTGIPARDAQLEAVAVDATRLVFLLQEGPARVVVIDAVAQALVRVIELVIEDGPLAEAWRDDESSRGEALVLLRNGHLLVGKEKRPPALLEFGPDGDEPLGLFANAYLPPDEPFTWRAQPYRLLRTWRFDDRLADVLDDLSDAAVGPDGHLYLLSDQSASIARVAPVDDASVVGSPFVGSSLVGLDTSWKLGGRPEKAEGLVLLPDGTAVVALDSKDETGNLLVLEPPIAARHPQETP